MRILKDDTIALVIDVQEKLFPHIDESSILESSIVKLLKGLNQLEIPLVLSEQYKKGLGETLEVVSFEIEPLFNFEKISFSCIDHENVKERFVKAGKKNVIIIGIEAHICVLQTAIDLKEIGFNPIVVVDAIGSRQKSNKEIALLRMQQENMTLVTVESILFELCRFAGTDDFKFISKLIK